MGSKSALARTASIRQLVFPAAGQGVLVTADAAGDTYGAWVDLALLALITAPTLVVGVALEVPSAVDLFTVDIGSCLGYANAAALNAVPAAIPLAHRAEVRAWFYTHISTSPGAGGGAATDVVANVRASAVSPMHMLPQPVYIATGVGILARCYGHTAAAVTVRVSVVCIQGW